MAWPGDTDSWPVVGLTHALQYEAGGQTTFNLVRMDPAAHARYLQTGRFPIGSMLELEIRRSRDDAEPARSGRFAGEVLSRSLHVKDERAGPGSWTFYSRSGGTGIPLPRSAECYGCHATHAAHDQVFTQFYPGLGRR
nr:cytochrome P460 family protein [Lysobacter sp. CAU 1642]